jgi:hypothetical protein
MKQQQAIQYLAFDVHQATIVANSRDAEGKVVRGHRGRGGQGDFAVGQELRPARRRPPLTRGLNRNHNPILKGVFKAAANAAIWLGSRKSMWKAG